MKTNDFKADKISNYNKIEISKSRLYFNLKVLQNINSAIAVAPVLKSNAYGHGLELIGPLLDEQDLPFICVNSLQEAISLRSSGVKAEILIMGYVDPKDLQYELYDFSFAAFNADYIHSLARYQKGAKIHVYVDTGLHREGLEFEHLQDRLRIIIESGFLRVEGLMSHFACSNDPFCSVTKKQIENFAKAKEVVATFGFIPQWFHFGGALALINGMTAHCNVVRCGKALFGIGLKNLPSANEKLGSQIGSLISSFQPTLQLTTRIIQIKEANVGDRVGYVESFIAKERMTLGILPIGYFDGVDRRLSNKGYVKIDGIFCPIVGMVSMNVTIVDITILLDPFIGQEVIVYSNSAQDLNSMDNQAAAAATIPQDLLIHLERDMIREVI